MRTPRGGRALSRAASGRVPGPRTTDSSLNGIMLMIIFITVLMVASFEHSLLREQRLADGDTRRAAHAGRDTCDGRLEGPGGIYEIRRAARETGTTCEAHSYPRGGRGLGGAHTDSEATAAAGSAVAAARGRQDLNVAGSTVE